jgi:hypothetical protein
MISLHVLGWLIALSPMFLVSYERWTSPYEEKDTLDIKIALWVSFIMILVGLLI